MGFRSRSEAEVRRYLQQKGFSTTALEAAIRRLLSLNYLNDDVFARNWALSRVQDHGYGPIKIDQELRAKGIALPVIRDTLRETFDQVDETAQARRLLTKHFKGERLSDISIARRAAALLQRRGYSGRVIFDLLRCSIEDE
ncbi:MAG TPA: regulatory protein RecX [Candidatus Binatia bacterium]